MRIRTLVVDDSQSALRAICALLEMNDGVEIVGTAENGIRALEQVASLRPDLVLADVQMPGMDGLEATRRIKTQPGAPRVIVFTIHDTGCYRDAAKGAGADLFIPKGKLGVLLAPAILSLFS